MICKIEFQQKDQFAATSKVDENIPAAVEANAIKCYHGMNLLSVDVM